MLQACVIPIPKGTEGCFAIGKSHLRSFPIEDAGCRECSCPDALREGRSKVVLTWRDAAFAQELLLIKDGAPNRVTHCV